MKVVLLPRKSFTVLAWKLFREPINTPIVISSTNGELVTNSLTMIHMRFLKTWKISFSTVQSTISRHWTKSSAHLMELWDFVKEVLLWTMLSDSKRITHWTVHLNQLSSLFMSLPGKHLLLENTFYFQSLFRPWAYLGKMRKFLVFLKRFQDTTSHSRDIMIPTYTMENIIILLFHLNLKTKFPHYLKLQVMTIQSSFKTNIEIKTALSVALLLLQ